MKVNVIQVADVAILKVPGDLNIGKGDVALLEGITFVLEKAHKRIIVDLHQVRLADSAGMQALSHCEKPAQDSGAEIVLYGVGGRVRDLLSTTQMIGHFEVFDNMADALAHFGVAELYFGILGPTDSASNDLLAMHIQRVVKENCLKEAAKKERSRKKEREKVGRCLQEAESELANLCDKEILAWKGRPSCRTAGRAYRSQIHSWLELL